MLNKWIGVGRLGKDPEIRYTPSGDPVTEFSIAVDETYKDKNGDKVTKTEWLKIIAWRKLAEICGQYLCKGKLVLIEGKIQTDQWEKDGVKHYTTKIVASNMQMLDSKRKEEGAPDDGRGPDADIPKTDTMDDVPF